ncbi:MAG: hypothetical protein AAB110_07570 [Candidatus Desantisbacteria bacterium]
MRNTRVGWWSVGKIGQASLLAFVCSSIRQTGMPALYLSEKSFTLSNFLLQRHNACDEPKTFAQGIGGYEIIDTTTKNFSRQILK